MISPPASVAVSAEAKVRLGEVIEPGFASLPRPETNVRGAAAAGRVMMRVKRTELRMSLDVFMVMFAFTMKSSAMYGAARSPTRAISRVGDSIARRNFWHQAQ